MGSVVNFLKKSGNVDFTELPFCDADIAIIGILSYANFEAFPFAKEKDVTKSMVDIHNFSSKDEKKYLTAHFLVPEEFNEFYPEFLKCKRYKDFRIGYFKQMLDEKEVVQFFGMTFEVADKVFIIFRGTDRSIVGWKEDFNLLLDEKVPAQDLAAKYLDDMVEIYKRKVYVLGHSKGGNLAYYAFFKCKDETKQLVKKTYNLDGPGFRGLFKREYEFYKNKIVKIVPNDDVVGLALEENNDFRIVKTNKVSALGHDLFSWDLTEKSGYRKFTACKKFTPYSIALRYAVSKFVLKIGKEGLYEIGDYILEIVSVNKWDDAKTIMDEVFKITFMYKVNKSIPDKKKRKQIIRYLNRFFSEYMHCLFHLREIEKKDLYKLWVKYDRLGEGDKA